MWSVMFILYYRPHCLCKFRNINGITRRLFTNNNGNEKTKDDQSYEKMVTKGMDRARRTILFHCTSNIPTLLSHCKRFGPTRNVYFIKELQQTRNGGGCLMVEFTNHTSISELKEEVVDDWRQHGDLIACRTRQLVYSKVGYDYGERFEIKKPRQRRDMKVILKKTQNLGGQMRELYEEYRMDDIDIAKRFFLASMVEDVVTSALPNAIVNMFGSSVSGLGRTNCDLDLNVQIVNAQELKNRSFRYAGQTMDDRHVMELITGLIRCQCPHTKSIMPILHAKVPIISFVHHTLQVDCDLSLKTKSGDGPLVSRTFYEMCCIQTAFPVLTMVIRMWAKSVGVTFSHPGPWPTNFMLTLLVVYYLQQHPHKLLPPMKDLHPGLSESQMTKMVSRTLPDDNLGDLLKEFFQFYKSFDFKKNAISVWTGNVFPNPTPDKPLYLENPIDKKLNCSVRVSKQHARLLQEQCAVSARKLEKTNSLAFIVDSQSSQGSGQRRQKPSKSVMSKDKTTETDTSDLTLSERISVALSDTEEDYNTDSLWVDSEQSVGGVTADSDLTSPPTIYSEEHDVHIGGAGESSKRTILRHIQEQQSTTDIRPDPEGRKHAKT